MLAKSVVDSLDYFFEKWYSLIKILGEWHRLKKYLGNNRVWTQPYF
jgi:hypothetical protein